MVAARGMADTPGGADVAESDATPRPTKEELPAKLRARIRIDAESGCWFWTGRINKDGYGRINWPPKRSSQTSEWRAHRLAWTLLVGPIPGGMTLDHLCYVTHCVNPVHLEIVTLSENARNNRSLGSPNVDGFCRNRRHPWVPANIYTLPGGDRCCRRCQEEKQRRQVATGKRRKARPGSGQGSIFG